MALVLKRYAEKNYSTLLYSCNCYIVKDEESGEAFVVDPGIYDADFENELKAFGIKSLTYILLTHGHFDHIAGIKELKDNFGGKIAVAEGDKDCLTDGKASLSYYFGCDYESAEADIVLSGEDSLSFAGGEIKVLYTPGHTKGSVCYVLNDMLFSGDTLFCGSMGRTDLPGGDEAEIKVSLKMLKDFEGDYNVYPGHSKTTTLENERKTNPFMKGL